MEQLAEQGLIDSEIGSGLHSGYRFKIELTETLDNVAGFEATSVPLSYPNSGRRSFFVDESGVIRAADSQGAPANRFDAALNYDRDPYFQPAHRLSYQEQPGY